MQFPQSISDQTAFLRSAFFNGQPGAQNSQSLTLPVELTADGDFCEEAAALQMVGHIARHCAVHEIDAIDLKSPSAQVLGEGSNYWNLAPWYTALRLLQHPRSPEIDPPRNLQKRPQSLKQGFGLDVQGVLLDRYAGFVQTDGAKHAFLVAIGSGAESRPPVLHIDRDVAPEAEFLQVLSRGFDNLGATDFLKNLSTDTLVSKGWFMREIAHMARELYLNSVEHGTKSEAGIFLPRSVRAFTVRLCQLDLSRLANQDAFTAMMSPFLGRCRDRVTRRRKLTGTGSDPTVPIPLIELSFVDNGPGFVRTWLSAEHRRETGRILTADLTNVTPDKEREIVQSCFDKHRTTKSTTGVGIGLYDVHKLMRRLGGIVVVRTSQVRLVRDYSRVVGPENTIPDFEYWDPKNAKLPEISGAAVSFLIPLVPLPAVSEN